MKYKNIFIGFVSVFLWVACAEEDHIEKNDFEAGKYPISFSTSIDGLSLNPVTRAASWENSNFGIQITETETSYIDSYKNIEYVASVTIDGDSILSPEYLDDIRYWSSEDQELEVSAYHPYYGVKDTWPTSLSVELEPEQSNAYNFNDNDHLYLNGQTITFSERTTTRLEFRHLFSLIKVKLQDGDGVSVNDLSQATVKIANTKFKATVAMEDGTVTADASQDIAEITSLRDNGIYLAIIIPQVLVSNTDFIIIEIGSQTYTYKIGSTSQTFESGKQYNYTVTVNQNNIEVTQDTTDPIQPWGDGDVIDNGTVTSIP